MYSCFLGGATSDSELYLKLINASYRDPGISGYKLNLAWARACEFKKAEDNLELSMRDKLEDFYKAEYLKLTGKKVPDIEYVNLRMMIFSGGLMAKVLAVNSARATLDVTETREKFCSEFGKLLLPG